MASSEGEVVKVRFGEGETGWAKRLVGHTAEIKNIPLADNLNIKDVVTLNDAFYPPEVISIDKRKYPVKTFVQYQTADQYPMLKAMAKKFGAIVEGYFGPGDHGPGMAAIAALKESHVELILEELMLEQPEEFQINVL